MADTKITGLAALTGANVAAGDQLVIVDVSDTTMAASGTDKNITADELRAAMSSVSRLLFGNGQDGTVTISSNTSLTADMYYDDLTVNSGIALHTGGYKVFVRGTLTLNGTIENDGYPNAANSGSRAAGEAGSISGGASAGAVGGTGAGATTAAASDVVGAQGGSGGSGSGGAGGTSGAVTVPIAVRGGVKLGHLYAAIMSGYHAANGNFVGTAYKGGTGGGAGGGDGTNNGGNGGGGAGHCVVFARLLTGSGTIAARGGKGFDASAGNCGGGGGGGGGAVWLFTTSPIGSVTLAATGGAGGAKTGTGVAGSAGSTGYTFTLAGG